MHGIKSRQLTEFFEELVSLRALKLSLFTGSSQQVLFNCTFESGTCGMVQPINQRLNWTRNSGSTQTPSTGPSVDHTLGLDGKLQNSSSILYQVWITQAPETYSIFH